MRTFLIPSMLQATVMGKIRGRNAQSNLRKTMPTTRPATTPVLVTTPILVTTPVLAAAQSWMINTTMNKGQGQTENERVCDT